MKDVCLAYLPEIAVGDYTIVVTGFEPLDLLKRIRRTVRQLGAASSDMLSESSMTLVPQPAWRLDERPEGTGRGWRTAAIPFAPPRSLVWPVEAACWLRHHNESNQ